MFFTATGCFSDLRVLTQSPARQLQRGYFRLWLRLVCAFVTMNHLSGGPRWPAETCRVNRVAADGRKVRGAPRVRKQGARQRRIRLHVPPPVERQPSPEKRRRLRLGKRNPPLEQKTRQDAPLLIILWRLSGCVRSSPGLISSIPK